MTDLVIAGTGDSRYLKSKSNFLTLYPTYEDFVDALVAGTLPVDFNGLNVDGVTAVGTALSKANLLSDATVEDIEAVMGAFTGEPTLDKAFAAIAAKLAAPGVSIETGSYTGAGTYGVSNPNSLTFDATPYVVLIFKSTSNSIDLGIFLNPSVTGVLIRGGTSSSGSVERSSVCVWSDKTLTWYQSTDAVYQLNGPGVTYRYISIGQG